MKTSTLKLLVLSTLAVTAVVGCKSNNGGGASGGGDAGDLIEGYTSLANNFANGPIVDGKYTAGGIQFETKNELKTTYATEPTGDMFNYLKNTWTYNSYHYCNMVDGLVENDKYGNIVGALAIGFKVTANEDGTETWSFQLRKNAIWVENKTGKKYADVVAQDFVSGAMYVLDPANGSGTSNLMTSFIAGAEEYYAALAAFEAGESQEEPDFADVGVKAVGDNIVEYTLIESTPYFASVLTYSPYLPVNAEYVESEGTDFGTTVNNILVNGAFRITEHTFESKMVYTKNESYYDKEHVYLDKVTRTFVPSTAALSTTREWYEAGTIDSFSVNANDEEGWNKYVVGQDESGSLKNPYDPSCNAIQSYDSATYIGYFNYNRTFYEFSPEATTTTAAQRRDTTEALINKDFRKGILFGMDVSKYLLRFGEENAINFLMRGYTNKELASAGGKDYTDYVNEVFNEKQGTTDVSLIGIDNGSDPVYNKDKSGNFFNAAHAALKDKVSGFPINIDYLGSMNVKLQAFEKAMLDSLEDSSKITVNGATVQMLKINYNVPATEDQNTSWGSIHSNFDFSLWSGWGPDYADPNTFLHTFAIFGDMVDYMGFPTSRADLATWELSEYAPQRYQALVNGEDASAAVAKFQEDVLGAYNALYLEAAAITDGTKLVERFQKFALAEYTLIYEEGLMVPWLSQNGYYASVSKTVPWQAGRASYGLTSDKFKNVVATPNAITKEQRAAVTAEYEARKEK